jgi:hypothetical protein
VLLVCGFVTAVASLTRPEAPVLILVLSVATILASSSPDDRRSALVGLWTGFGVVFLPYFAWRLWHFGRLLPNPAYCKLAYGGDPWVLPAELWEFGRYYVLFALIQSPRSLDARHFLLAAVPLVYAALLIGVDPILAYWNRLAMPALPPLLVLATVGMTNIGTWVSRSSRARHESVLFVVVVLVSFLTTRGLGGMLQSYADRYARLMSTRRAVGDWVHETLAPNDRFVTGDAGLIPYVANARAIDALCLNSREATERPGRRDPHAFWSWILEQRPAVVLLPSSSSARLEGPSTAVSERPGFRDGYRLVKVFVTPGHRYHYFAYRRGD